MSPGGEAENGDFIRFDSPFFRMSADQFDRPERIFLRCGIDVRRHPVLKDKRMESHGIEFFRNGSSFMGRADGIAASGTDNDAAAHLVSGKEIGFQKGLKFSDSVFFIFP